MNEQMVIPFYQREYVWNDAEGKDFFEDLELSTKKEPLFLGNFIFHVKEIAEGENDIYEIVDGQQRITTILIFLIACRNYCKKENLSDALKQHIQLSISSYTHDPRFTDGVCPRLEAAEKIRDVFKAMSNIEWNESQKVEKGNVHAWNRISKAYNFFKQKLEEGEYDKDKLKELFDKALKTEVIKIEVRSEIEAIDIFERVNTRGKRLAVYELMKAYLFSNKLKEGPELASIEEDWKEISSNADDTDSKLKKVLYFFYFSKKGYIASTRLYKELKKIAEEDLGVRKFVDELNSFSKFYSIVSSRGDGDMESEIEDYLKNVIGLGENAFDQDRIKRISKSIFSMGLFKVVSAFPLIYSSLIGLSRACKKAKGDDKKEKKEIDAWINLLKFLEHFTFTTTRIAHMTSQYGGPLEKLYGKYCTKFSEGDGEFRGAKKSV